MKWRVSYRELKRSCCPRIHYWVALDTTIVADTVIEVEQKLKKGKLAVEIQKISPDE